MLNQIFFDLIAPSRAVSTYVDKPLWSVNFINRGCLQPLKHVDYWRQLVWYINQKKSAELLILCCLLPFLVWAIYKIDVPVVSVNSHSLFYLVWQLTKPDNLVFNHITHVVCQSNNHIRWQLSQLSSKGCPTFLSSFVDTARLQPYKCYVFLVQRCQKS